MPVISMKSATRSLESRPIYHRACRVRINALPSGIILSTIMRAAVGAHTSPVRGQSFCIRPQFWGSDRRKGRWMLRQYSSRSSTSQRHVECSLLSPMSPPTTFISPPCESLEFRYVIWTCTNMPSGTLFSSLLNHLDEATEWVLDLDDGVDNVSVAKTEGAGNFSDVSITSMAGTSASILPWRTLRMESPGSSLADCLTICLKLWAFR